MSKKIKIQITSWLNGSVLFEYEAVDNTIKKTVEEAVIGSADLRYANLRSADLRYADLGYANLRSADLRYADLGYANLRSAKNAKLAVAMTRILPEGDIIGWKKCKDDIIVKLLIPAKAKRSHAFGRKCRAEYAQVLQVYKAKEAYSTYENSFVYRKGETVKPTTTWDKDFTNECSSGIHFYITREEAEAHAI